MSATDNMVTNKVKEAQAYISAAEKQLRTSLSRWKPNYDMAADQYTQAAHCLRLANDLESSMKYSRLASENYILNKSYFHAAKALETALSVGKEIVPPEELHALALESASLYQQHGSGDSAAAVLAKAAKILQQDHPELSYKLYQQAAEASFAESSAHSAIEYISKASRLLVQLNMLDAAIESVVLEMGYHNQTGNTGAIGRLAVVGVLIQLVRGDFVAAQKFYKEWGSKCEQAEKETLEMLLQGMDDGDIEMVRRALKAPFIRSMDVEYARLAANFPMPEFGLDEAAAPNRGQAAADDDDENPFEAVDLPHRDQGGGGLC